MLLNSASVNSLAPSSNKAVAEGGVSFYLEHFVSARIVKMTYGTHVSVLYRSTDPEHVARSHKKEFPPSGVVMVPDAFCSMLTKECWYSKLCRSRF